VVLAALLAVTLAACGDEETPSEADQPGVDAVSTEEAVFDIDASPGAIEDEAEVNAPMNIETLELAITEGGIEPSTLQGFVDSEYGLIVTGDGTEHTLTIEGIVDEEPIAADGETQIEFSVSGEPSERDITLDGESVGTFEVQDAAGIDDE
jgi:hypothetical protein